MLLCGKVLIGFGIIGLISLIGGIVIGFSGAFDGYINNQIENNVRLQNGTDQYERWETLPFPLQLKIYVFNVTNPDEILTGATPIVEEVGPFVYNEYRQKENITYDEETDRYKYKERLTFEFDDELSALSDDTAITVLNIPLQGIFLTIEGTTSVTLINNWWQYLFQDGYFMTVSARTLFFEGYQFCIADSLTVFERMACTTIKTLIDEHKTLTYDDQMIEFAFFAYKNDSTDGEFEISGGNNDINSIAEIFSWEGQEYIDTWVGAESTCNQIRGRESSLFPPFNNESSNFDIFNTDICRVMTLKTTDTAEYEDIRGIVATLNIDNLKNDGDNECYCIQQTKDLDGELECLPDGFADLQSCVGSPVVLSYPHMLWADETYRNTIQGLAPIEENHQTFVVLEPDTGTPLQGAKRVQFNIITRPITGIDITSDLTPAVFPLIWVEEGFDLPEEQVQQIKDKYLNKLKMLSTASYSLIGVGGGLVLVCLGYFALKLIF